jgi:hypothetical protein
MLPGTWWRVFRAVNRGTTPLAGDVYVAESDSYTDGVPDTPAKWKAKITQGFNQTLMALYTVPTDKMGYVTCLYSTIYQLGSSPNSIEKSGTQSFRIRPNGETFQAKHVIDINNTHAHTSHKYDIPLYVGSQVDIEMAVLNVTTNTTISAGFEVAICS